MFRHRKGVARRMGEEGGAAAIRYTTKDTEHWEVQDAVFVQAKLDLTNKL